MMNFIPLNVFTNFAILKSALTLDEYFSYLKKHKISVAGISDPDFIYGFPYFKKLAAKNSIKPLYGVRLKIEETELVFFVINSDGYRALMTMFEKSNLGQLDATTLKKYTKDLVTILPTNNLIDVEDLVSYTKKWAMATSSFYLGLEQESIYIAHSLRSFAEKYNYEIVAFPHIKYINKEDYSTFKMIEAIREGTNLDIKAEFSGPNYFLESELLEEIYLPEELENTKKVSDLLSFTLDIKHPLNLPLPHDVEPKTEIIRLCNATLQKLGLTDDERYIKRLDHELKVITKLGFLSYFLVVSDYVAFAKNNDILVGYGRGSAPGSLVSYLLGITSADPIKYDLLFERFLNPERVSLPDIDVDFMDTRRGEVIDYIRETYGEDKVAQIITFQTNAAKASLRDTGRIFNIDLKFINRLSKSLENGTYSLRDSYRNIPAFKQLIDADSYNLEIIKHAVKLEGFPRQSGLHAAGIIIDGEPLSRNLPTFINNNTRVTQYEMAFLEEQGFLKVDILGLTNLTFIHNIMKAIKETKNIDIDFYNLTFDDPAIYKVISDGHTAGLFQLESEGMRKAINRIKPSNFDDISNLLALYRPGPMQYINDYALAKEGQITIDYLNDDFKRILEPTYGIMIYQEQIMQIVTAMADFSLAEADLLRRAISKKDEKIILNRKKDFMDGAKKKGFSLEQSEKVFADILKFADYGFNKSHSVVYAMLTMALAYFKTNYPYAFYRELLQNVISDTKKFQQVRDELKALNIKILPPDINLSGSDFVEHNGGLVYPFSVIVGLNNETALKLVRLRNEKTFVSLADFFFRAYNQEIDAKEITALIEAGALDTFNPNRTMVKKIFATFLPTLDSKLFSEIHYYESMIVEPVDEDVEQIINDEVRRLRFPLTRNPLKYIKVENAQPISAIEDKNNEYVKVFGVLSEYQQIKTKKGSVMAFASLSDYENELSLVLFPNIMVDLPVMKVGQIYIMNGRLELKDEVLQLIVQNVERYKNE